jgi:hypothetical protein
MSRCHRGEAQLVRQLQYQRWEDLAIVAVRSCPGTTCSAVQEDRLSVKIDQHATGQTIHTTTLETLADSKRPR